MMRLELCLSIMTAYNCGHHCSSQWSVRQVNTGVRAGRATPGNYRQHSHFIRATNIIGLTDRAVAGLYYRNETLFTTPVSPMKPINTAGEAKADFLISALWATRCKSC